MWRQKFWELYFEFLITNNKKKYICIFLISRITLQGTFTTCACWPCLSPFQSTSFCSSTRWVQSHPRRDLWAVYWNLTHRVIKASLDCGDSCCSSPVLFGSSQVASLPASQAEREDGKQALSAAQDEAQATAHFVFEEGSGYMEPALHFLAVAHTIISLCCIIGYYCLKVHWLHCQLLYPNNKLYLVYTACFKALALRARQPANISLFQHLS